MSNFAPWTPGQIPEDYEARVAADTRNILEKTILRALNSGYNSQNPTNLTQPNSQENPTNSAQPNTQGKENNPPLSQAVTEAEFKEIFPDEDDEDHDDSEEIFQQILKRAEEAAKREMEMNKKNPLLTINSLNMLVPPKRTRKRKNKTIEKTLAIMNNFKKSLVEPVELPKPPQEKTITTLSSADSSKVIARSSIVNNFTGLNSKDVKIYPKWETTATYTPIFHRTTNPNWTNIEKLEEESDKMYTPVPRHTHSWMDNIAKTDNCYIEAPLSHTYYRSNIATNNSSILKNSVKNIMNKEAPIASDTKTNVKSITNTETQIETDNPAISNIPQRSSTVRFKSLSPEQISTDNYDVSSTFSREDYSQFEDSNNENNDNYLYLQQSQINNFYLTPIQNQTYEKDQKYLENTFQDQQQILKYEISTKNVVTPILGDPLNSSTPIQNMNTCFTKSPIENLPLNHDGHSSISSISLMEDDNFKKFIDTYDESNQFYLKKCQQYPQSKKLFEVHQENAKSFNPISRVNSNASSFKNGPWNSNDQSPISPISLMEDNDNFKNFIDSYDESNQFYPKQCQQYPQSKKLFEAHQEYAKSYSSISKVNSNGSSFKTGPWNGNDQLSVLSISPIRDNNYAHANQFIGENHQYHLKHYREYPQKTKFFQVEQQYTEKIKFTSKSNPSELNKNAHAPFVVQKFVNNLRKNLSNSYNMELKCSMKMKQQFF